MRYRGPEEFGIYKDKNIGLGHARLSIIDLSGGQQPVHNEDKTIWIVYNGEVFNYLELILKKGINFIPIAIRKLLSIFMRKKARIL